MSAADSAGVRLPPPLYYVAGLAAGWIATAWAPTPWFPPAGTAPWLGGALLAVSGALALSCLLLFFRSKTSLLPHRPASSLVIAGPYRFTRNPMYLAMALLYAGIAVLVHSLWAIMLLPLVLALVRRRVISREEAYLERRFGAEYQRYRSRVRRWL